MTNDRLVELHSLARLSRLLADTLAADDPDRLHVLALANALALRLATLADAAILD